VRVHPIWVDQGGNVPYMIETYETDSDGVSITYRVSGGGRGSFWVCLCTNGQWVACKHLREDDVRLELVYSDYEVNEHVTSQAENKAEELTQLLLKG
jgi:hypothetical protein